jgi:hypothetical protein
MECSVHGFRRNNEFPEKKLFALSSLLSTYLLPFKKSATPMRKLKHALPRIVCNRQSSVVRIEK